MILVLVRWRILSPQCIVVSYRPRCAQDFTQRGATVTPRPVPFDPSTSTPPWGGFHVYPEKVRFPRRFPRTSKAHVGHNGVTPGIVGSHPGERLRADCVPIVWLGEGLGDGRASRTWARISGAELSPRSTGCPSTPPRQPSRPSPSIPRKAAQESPQSGSVGHRVRHKMGMKACTYTLGPSGTPRGPLRIHYLQVLVQFRQLILPQAVDVVAVESSARAAGHDELRNAVLPGQGRHVFASAPQIDTVPSTASSITAPPPLACVRFSALSTPRAGSQDHRRAIC